jgi:hypothetical protein
MANESIKIRMKASRGNPAGGIIRAGAVVQLPKFWAERFIEDGTAERVVEDSASGGTKTKKAPPKNKK